MHDTGYEIMRKHVVHFAYVVIIIIIIIIIIILVK